MKTSQQVIGLPVVSITDGNEIGKVKSLMINAVKGKVDFFVIDSAVRSLAGGVIPVDKVLGIGADALTIMAAEDVCDIAGSPEAIGLLQKNVAIRGTRVLTRKGSLAGVAGDIHLDEDNACDIAGVEFVPGLPEQAGGIIPKAAIITFAQNLLVVEEDFMTRLTGELSNQTAPASAADGKTETPVAEEPQVAAATFTPSEDTVLSSAATGMAGEPDISVEGLFEETPVDASAESLAADRRIQYLRGRRITRDIVAETGEAVAQAGDLIDDALMERASKAGCLVELVMNNEA